METILNTSNYQHITEIDFFGQQYKSTYNCNYYYSDLDCELILEICNDDDCYQYYRIEDGHDTKEYLGLTYGVYGIFDEEYEDKNGTFVTLKSTWC
jgi:hypothetical protein